jgi:hypothetical protein
MPQPMEELVLALPRIPMSRGRRQLLTGLALAVWPLLSAGLPPLQSAEPSTGAVRVPFAQVLDIEAVRAVVHSAPAALLATIARHGVELLRVPSAAPARPVNPLLAPLPEAGAELQQQAEFRDGYDGRVVLRASACCPRPRDLILIRDTALSYTLIHEFAQSRLRPLQPGEPDDVIELRFATAFNRLKVYQRRLYDDPYRLLEPLWRRDILLAQADVARDLFARIRLGQSQEVIVERLLFQLIDERSPYFDEGRRAEGRRYALAMLDNAIDLFNAVHDSAVFVADTVTNLRAAIIEGDIPADAPGSLADADVQAVRQATAAVRATLEPVRAEIELLKAMLAR